MDSVKPWLFPAACYLVVTLGLPWLNGAGHQPQFGHHAAEVCLWVALLVVAFSVARWGISAIKAGNSRQRHG